MARRFTLPILILIIAASGVVFAGADDCPVADDPMPGSIIVPEDISGGGETQYGDPDDITGNKGPGATDTGGSDDTLSPTGLDGLLEEWLLILVLPLIAT